MKTSFYRKKLDHLLANGPSPESVKRLSRQIANSFLDCYLKDLRYESEYIDLLCEMTTFSDDPELVNPATSALFGIIVESLCDDFEALQTETYNQVMSQVISFCRKTDAGKDLNRRLDQFNLHSRADLYNRINRIRNDCKPLADRKQVKKILLLSRVTIGADVAITSVVIQRLAAYFPDAEMVIIGGTKMGEIYGGHPDLKTREVAYSRRGGLIQRLSSWFSVLSIINEEIASLNEDEILLVDPDSRFSQLGILPLVASDDNYYFFDSRSDSSFNKKMSMLELTNDWLDKITGEKDFVYSKVWIEKDTTKRAGQIIERIRGKGASQIIAVNFGVGGNPRKKAGEDLDEKILRQLLEEPETVVLLDKGFGDEEEEHINSLMSCINDAGFPVVHASFKEGVENTMSHGVIGIETGIGEMAALIKHADEFIGYDSA